MDRLTSAEKRVARALLANYPLIGLAPVAEFAAQAGASAATVLRFVAQIGYGAYPEFQRALRIELEKRVESPLQRSAARQPRKRGKIPYLETYLARVAANLEETAARIPSSEFEAVCTALATGKGGCHLAGGRFTDALAGYMEAHLRLVRPGVRRLDGRSASRLDQLLDVRPGDIAVIFDVRRYDPQLLELAERLKSLRAFIVLVTDEWISPISRQSRIVLPCRTDTGSVWDANTALFALVEAIIAHTTELAWPTAGARIGRSEHGKALARPADGEG